MRFEQRIRCFFLLIACAGSLAAGQSVLAQDDSGFKFVEIKVVDPDGKPAAEVSVDVDLDGMQFPMPTNDEGMISLNVPSGSNSRLRLKVVHEDFVADSLSWRGGKSIPEQYTIKLEKGVAIGGIVQDQEGNPIEGVKISASTPQVSADRVVTMHVDELATTDSEGRWQVQAKDRPNQKYLLKLSHENYISQNSFRELATWSQLKELNHVLTLEKGIELRGKVTGDAGEPIAGATLFLGSSRYVSSQDKKRLTRKTNEQGEYQFGNVTPGPTVVTVSARGWSPELRTIQIARDADPIDFRLDPGKTIRIRVADPDDIPIADASIAADDWRGHRSLPQEFYRGKTNGQGIWECNSMPDEPIQFDLFKRGHMSSRNHLLKPGDDVQTIVMKWPLLVTGRVVDAESGLPLEKFNIVHGIDWGNGNTQVHWERYNVKEGREGKYSTEFNEPRSGHYVRIEAAGYRPGVSRVLRDDEGEVKINFELEEGAGPKGKIFTPDGKPAAGVELLVATPDEQVMIYNGHAQQYEGRPSAKSDENGNYKLPFYEATAMKVICRHDTGYAQVTGTQLAKSADITLRGWGAVEGSVFAGEQPLADVPVQLYFNQRWVQGAPHVNWSYSTRSDAQGKFKFDRVAGEKATVGRTIEIGNTGNGAFMSSFSHTQQVTLQPGKTAKIKIGGEGRTVMGKLKVPDGYAESVIWNMASIQVSQQNRPASKGFFNELGRAIAQLGNQRSERPNPTFLRTYAATADADGNFQIVDVMPGNYSVYVQLYPSQQAGQNRWQPLGTANKTFTIAENAEEGSQDSVDLGELTLTMTKPITPAGGANADVFISIPAPVD